MAEKHHRIIIKPGETLEIVLAERLDNGFVDDVGGFDFRWQDRDAPAGQIAKQGRELQVNWRAERGRVGPVVIAHR